MFLAILIRKNVKLFLEFSEGGSMKKKVLLLLVLAIFISCSNITYAITTTSENKFELYFDDKPVKINSIH